jgi:hypothetical protein
MPTVNLAWNRAVCVSADSKRRVSLPLGYEGLYGILTGKIMAYVKSRQLDGGMAPLTPEQQRTLGQMTAAASQWDIETELHPGMFPTRQTVPMPTKDTAKAVGRIASGEAPSESDSKAAPDAAPAPEAADAREELAFASVNEDTCSKGYFAQKYSPSKALPLRHIHNHCCALACVGYKYMSRVSGPAGLNNCCRMCNRHYCPFQNSGPVREVLAEVTRVEAPCKLDSTPAVYSFSV